MCLAVLLILLTGCGALAQQPPAQAVRLAVSQQLTHAQQLIAQELGISAQPEPNFKIDRLDIKSRERLSAKKFQRQGYPSDIYKVKGTVEATLTASHRKVQQSGPFEVYLGTNPKDSANTDGTDPQSKIETWFMISPDEPKPPQ